MPGDFSSGARLEIRITPDDVGKRVSVRQLTEITDGHPTFTDTVGVLVSWDAEVVSVTRRTGETVRIPRAVLVAGKVVPPAPVRRGPGVPAVTAEELERIASRAWPAAETSALGGWTLRASGGFTRRANSVLVGGDPGMPVDRALAEVARWYGDRGLIPYLQVPDSSPLGAALDGRAWIREGDTLVRTAPLAPLTSLPDTGVTLSRTPGPDWLAAYRRTGERADAALAVVSGGPAVWFATTPGGIGRAVVDGPWALFGAVEVAPSRRRRGLATAVMGALARQVYDEGATAGYLQVEADNAVARAFYDRLGFLDHHGYHYRRPAA
ncbi:GNAT family N-acetyltransferase [Actinacidiphila sp. ITFR-21]|uniref:GNAT family N-acetyltransferase n=1 Tax=Actinacidiphila sp. ITFR-21 TaxID=3075199 RepID=UPI00288AD489|nr:GNAT family N-acetyltransferase [Streptomyces sp. ITFR-21]WNI17548.1 GNAT family N-acetyltransferase [Streptomyces sp. ITFR-21]